MVRGPVGSETKSSVKTDLVDAFVFETQGSRKNGRPTAATDIVSCSVTLHQKVDAVCVLYFCERSTEVVESK